MYFNYAKIVSKLDLNNTIYYKKLNYFNKRLVGPYYYANDKYLIMIKKYILNEEKYFYEHN